MVIDPGKGVCIEDLRWTPFPKFRLAESESRRALSSIGSNTGQNVVVQVIVQVSVQIKNLGQRPHAASVLSSFLDLPAVRLGVICVSV